PVSARPAAMATRFCSAIPTLKKRSGKASRKGRMSVYLPRSAVSPTISCRFLPAATSACPNGASTAARFAAVASSSPIARVRARSAMSRPLLELRDERIPLARVDPHEMRLLARLKRRDALAGKRAQDDRLRLARPRPRHAQRFDQRSHVVAVDFLRIPAEGAP